MIINSDSFNSGGLGDMIGLAYLAEASKATYDPISFFTKEPKKIVMLKVLGQEYSDNWQDAIDMTESFRVECKDLSNKPRWHYWRDLLNRRDLKPVCPTLQIGDPDVAWVNSSVPSEKPLVLLFPETSQFSRSWLTSHWMNLAGMLEASGFYVVAVCDSDGFKGIFHHLFKSPAFDRLAAMLQRCSLAITADSFPAHLAAVAGCPTLVLLGPTKSECVFGHCRDRVKVLTVSAKRVPCVSCAGDTKKIRAACAVACEALVMLQPVTVFKAAQRMMKEKKIPCFK